MITSPRSWVPSRPSDLVPPCGAGSRCTVSRSHSLVPGGLGVGRGAKTVAADAAEANLFLEKAMQFLESCRLAREGGHHDSVMLTAVHATISAADAVTVVLARRRSADPNHQRAADLLEQVSGSS